MESIRQVPAEWIARTGNTIDRIRINIVSADLLNGREVWVKKRTFMSRLLVPVANAFFSLAGNPVEVFATSPEWQNYELATFRLLNGDTHGGGILSENSIYTVALPGQDLTQLLRTNRLNARVMALVGAAFCRMHRTLQPANGELFSHGDPHLGNVVYEHATESVGWLDFETVHRSGMEPVARHADDLLVFLLDLVGRSGDEQWTMLSPAFLNGYPDASVVAELRKRLHPPNGLGAIWWAVRTSYLPSKILRKRIEWLRQQL